MKINEQILKEIEEAIKVRTSESFEYTVSGGMKHFITSEQNNAQGHYIGSTEVNGKLFKIYMI